MTAPKIYSQSWADSIEFRLKALEPKPKPPVIGPATGVVIPSGLKTTVARQSDGSYAVRGGTRQAIVNELITSTGEGITCNTEDVDELWIVNCDILSVTNCMFLTRAKKVYIIRTNARIAKGASPNQYVFRGGCEELYVEGTAGLAYHWENYQATNPEALMRLIGCHKFTIKNMFFEGDRLVLGGGAQDEAVDEQVCEHGVFDSCGFDLDNASPDCMRIGLNTNDITFKNSTFNIADGHRLAAIIGRDIKFKTNTIKRHSEPAFYPLIKTNRDFKQPDAEGLVIT